MSRRGNGEGSIFYETSRSRWVGLIELETADGARIRRKVTGRTKSAVAEKLRRVRRDESHVRGSTSVRTVGDLLERWLTTAAVARLGEHSSAFGDYSFTARHHLTPGLGHLSLRQLHPEHVDNYLAAKAADGYSRSTLVKHRSVLGQALRWGIKRRYLAWDPASLAEMPPAAAFEGRRRHNRTPRALTTDQARVFCRVAERRGNGLALVLSLVTGLRPGEVTALAWDDIDLDSGVVHIRRAWKGTGEHRALGPPKTRGSIRAVSIPPSLASKLRVHRAAQRELRTAATTQTDLGLVFATRSGGGIDSANLRKLCAEIAADAEIGHLAPYDLRHTAASLLSEAGVRNELLADLLGHVDTRMVERHYRHRLSDTVDVAVGPMSALLDR
jgi:integrase